MATWRDQLRPASFRGVVFHVRSRERSGGRRLAEHVYPERDALVHEDLGRTGRTWSVEAILIGDGYMTARDRLVAALETKGPGEYVDHWGQSETVVARSFSLAENIAEGGSVQVRIDFAEDAAEVLHTVRLDTGHAVTAAADAAAVALEQTFADTWSVGGIDELAARAVGVLFRVTDGMASILSAPAARASFIKSQVGAMLRSITSFRSSLAGLLPTSGSLAAALGELTRGLLAAFAPGWPRWHAARALRQAAAGFPAVAPFFPSSGERQAATNDAAVRTLIGGLAAVETARAASTIAFDSHDAAVMARDATAADLDAEEATAPDALFRALADARAAMVRDVTARGADLARLSQVTPNITEPALVIAQRLYGDAGREVDIVSRNPIRHPGFVPGGRPLEILANAG